MPSTIPEGMLGTLVCPITQHIPAQPILFGPEIFEYKALYDYFQSVQERGDVFRHPTTKKEIKYEDVKRILDDEETRAHFAQLRWKQYYIYTDTDTEDKQAFLNNFNTELSLETLQILNEMQYSVYLKACIAQNSWNIDYLE